jgi:hypothetical protein
MTQRWFNAVLFLATVFLKVVAGEAKDDEEEENDDVDDLGGALV